MKRLTSRQIVQFSLRKFVINSETITWVCKIYRHQLFFHFVNCLWYGNSKLINGFCPSGIFRQLRDNELTLTFKGTCVTLVKIRNLSVKGLLHYLKCTYMQDTTRITELSSFDVQIFCSINRFKNLLQMTRGEI